MHSTFFLEPFLYLTMDQNFDIYKEKQSCSVKINFVQFVQLSDDGH